MKIILKMHPVLRLFTLIFILAFNNKGANALARPINKTAAKTQKKTSLSRRNEIHTIKDSYLNGGSTSQLLRLKLIIDSLNYDDIIIGFNAGASSTYNGNEDAEYWRGLNSPEGLSSFSSDGIQLSQNYLPLPKQKPLIIRLNVEAKYSGAFTLQRTELDSLPPIYEVWLMDNYKKDSLDLRNNNLYNFTIDKKDTTTFGKNRFQVVVRQNHALGIHLLGFSATKALTGAQIIWKTENEQDYTNFTVERSSDNGITYNELTAFISNRQGTYSYVDKSLLVSTYQYRLKIEDFNGIVSYSNVVTLLYGSLSTPIAVNSMVVYPNPAGSTINIAINPNSTTPSNASNFQANSIPSNLNAINNVQSYGIKITNSTGSIIRAATVTQTNWQNNIDNLTPGAYVIQVINNNNNSIVGKSTFIKL